MVETDSSKAVSSTENIKSTPIPLTIPDVADGSINRIKSVLASKWLTQGNEVLAFESEIRRFTGSDYAIAYSNCTTALTAALIAVGVAPGDFVITTSHSFIATANAIRLCGAEPVFIDIEADGYNIDPDSIQTFINDYCSLTESGLILNNPSEFISNDSPLFRIKENYIGKISALLAVHQFGIPCDLKRILEITNKFGINVVEDAACAIGSEILLNDKWIKIGGTTGSSASCFSFHPRKVLTTGEGGMILTNDPEVSKFVRLYRHHGMSLSDLDRHKLQNFEIEEYLITGTNSRMSDVHAALGNAQLEELSINLENRLSAYNRYQEILRNIDTILLPKIEKDQRPNWQSLPVRLYGGNLNLVVQFITQLKSLNIHPKLGIQNIHKTQHYQNTKYLKSNRLRHSDEASNSTLLLPIYGSITNEQIETVTKALVLTSQKLISKWKI